MKFSNLILMSVLVFAFVGCSNHEQVVVNKFCNTSRHSNDMTKDALRAHIEFLADDLLKGRGTGTAEYEIAAQYVASQLKQFGLKPAGENGTWFQSVPFTKKYHEPSSVSYTHLTLPTKRIV